MLGLIPGMLSGYYLHNYGPAASMMGFRPLLLLVAMGFTFIVLFISIFQPVRRMSRISPIEAMKYMGREVPVKKRERSSSSENGNKLFKMAWRNIFRNRKDTWMTIASIALGLIMALCSVVIVTGTDYRNSIMQEPDFSISTWDSPYDNDEYTEASYPINQAFLESVQAIDGVESFDIGYGGYVNLNTSEAAWMPLLRGTKIADGLQDTEDEKEYAEAVRTNYVAGYTIVDEVYIDELEEYLLKNGLNVDMESFRSGTGVIALHHNKLSEQLTIAGQEVIGESITISNLHEESAGEMNFCGYLNMNAKGFPSLLCGVNTSSRPYLIMSRAAYESLDLTETILRLNIEVVSILEPSIKVQLNELIELQNERITDVNRETAIYSSAKSDTLEVAESYLTIIRIIMYGISSLLILLGLLNYFNVTATKLISRNKEFAVMESIGMTRRQIRKLLVYEGMYYSGIISIIVLTIGSAAMYGVGVALKSRLAYAKFVYPYMELMVIIIVLFAVCATIPLIMYRAKTESIINSLRHNIE